MIEDKLVEILGCEVYLVWIPGLVRTDRLMW